MQLNGKYLKLETTLSIHNFLQSQGFDITRIATELNGEIVSRSLYEKTMLKDTDVLEVVAFVGGG